MAMHRSPSTRRAALALLAAALLGGCAARPTPDSAPPLAPTRAALTDGAGTVGARVLQLESGYRYTGVRDASRHEIGEALLRYGVGDASELRVALNSYTLERDGGRWARGIGDIAAGVVLPLLRGGPHRFVPATAVLVESSIPTGDDDWGSRHPLPSGTLVLEWAPHDQVGINSNLRLTYDLQARAWTPDALHSLVVQQPLGPQLRGFADYTHHAPLIRDGPRTHHLALGLGYDIDRDLVLDLWSGAARRAGSTEALFGFGLSRRW
jgi:hypothetical protein